MQVDRISTYFDNNVNTAVIDVKIDNTHYCFRPHDRVVDTA